MMSKISVQAFILHHRPYRESSALVDLLTDDIGYLRAVWRGARSRKGKQLCQAFTPCQVVLSGKGELKTVNSVEVSAYWPRLQGNDLLAGMYLNELILKCLPSHEVATEIFSHYAEVIEKFSLGEGHESLLRHFEWHLLQFLGYGFSFPETGEHSHYLFSAEHGFIPSAKTDASNPHLFSDATLTALAEQSWQDMSVLQHAKRLMRLALAPLLSGKPLASRELYWRPRAAISDAAS